MREIKFRVWDKEKNRMITPDGKGLDTSYEVDFLIRMDGGIVKEVDWALDWGNSFIENEELKNIRLMQYTGLKDTNGQKIYEGDIIKIPFTYYDRIEWVIEVPYDEYIIGKVTFNEKSSAFGIEIKEDEDELSKGFNSFDFVFENIGYECEIIGNIYENPELLYWEEL